jgi:ABC-type ATPase with predicted acetyltransferase domain
MTRHRHELFQITKYARRYDRETGKFIIDINYKTKTAITPRTIAVAEAFGLGIDNSQRHVLYDNVELNIGPQDIVYITGESGSGKSILLKTLEKDIKQNPQLGKAINIANIKPNPNKPIIETVGKTINESLTLLSQVGLNDAFLFLRKYRELSDGQRYRYRIAKMIESDAKIWIMDEFCATLDRDTAKIVAFNTQKLARQLQKTVVAATTHIDLLEDLAPSLHIHKKLGKKIQVEYYQKEPPEACSLLKEIKIEKGTRSDYQELASLHYRSHHVGVIRNIFRATRGSEELCGVIVYTYPAIEVAGRRKVLPAMPISQLNQKLSNIMRVIVHPKYRTIGLGQKLVQGTLQKCGTPYVEATAVMAKYNPFFEKAGMTKIQESMPPKQAVAIREALTKLDFNVTVLASEKYVMSQLKRLTEPQLLTLRQSLIQNAHLRFLKEFFHNQPYGKPDLYKEKVQNASFEKLAKLIHITALLLQSKVYLFWQPKQSETL